MGGVEVSPHVAHSIQRAWPNRDLRLAGNRRAASSLFWAYGRAGILRRVSRISTSQPIWTPLEEERLLMAKWNIKLPFWRDDIKQIPCGRPLANGFTIESFIHPLAEFLDGKFEIQPPDPPGNLGELLAQLKIRKGDLALIALKPILDAI